MPATPPRNFPDGTLEYPDYSTTREEFQHFARCEFEHVGTCELCTFGDAWGRSIDIPNAAPLGLFRNFSEHPQQPLQRFRNQYTHGLENEKQISLQTTTNLEKLGTRFAPRRLVASRPRRSKDSFF